VAAIRLTRRSADFPATRFTVIIGLTVEDHEWAEAHFFIAVRTKALINLLFGVIARMKRDEIIKRIEDLAGQIANPRDIEIVEVELKGAGKNQLLRIYIDKPEGVTHTDCEFVSRELSAALDSADGADDLFPGSWELEVSSPGVERKLSKWKDWQRFTGKKVKVVLNAPPATDAGPPVPAYFEGLLARRKTICFPSSSPMAAKFGSRRTSGTRQPEVRVVAQSSVFLLH